jgi:hypothetical protein
MSNILGLLLIKELDEIGIVPSHPAFEIVKRHFNDKNKDVLECQEELISNGYKEFAKL